MKKHNTENEELNGNLSLLINENARCAGKVICVTNYSVKGNVGWFLK